VRGLHLPHQNLCHIFSPDHSEQCAIVINLFHGFDVQIIFFFNHVILGGNFLKKIGVVQYGLGPIGQSITKLLAEKKNIEIAGAVDIDPKKIGQPLSILTGKKELSRIKVTEDLEDIKIKNNFKVAIHTTGSYLKEVTPQLKEIANLGFNIISSCEELSYPWKEHQKFAREINDFAERNKISIVGTGINPGFLMDTLVITLTGLCQKISKIECKRIQDTSERRLPFQKKIGTGLTLDEFQKKANSGSIRHVGFRESIWMIADSLNWNLDSIIETTRPIIAEKRLKSKFFMVEKGLVAGIDQTAIGTLKDSELIRLNLLAYLGCANPKEELSIEGFPKIQMEIKGGVNGDFGTTAIIVNSIPKIVNSEPGLHTMRDLLIPSALL
jgi:4-hydroxy-tetrahydrodipicolinate reductase